MKTQILLALITFACVISSCKKDDPEPARTHKVTKAPDKPEPIIKTI